LEKRPLSGVYEGSSLFFPPTGVRSGAALELGALFLEEKPELD
jgi:hypothetical protein